MKRITVALAGLGSRGKDTYAPVAKLLPEKMEITAIADIVEEKGIRSAKGTVLFQCRGDAETGKAC